MKANRDRKLTVGRASNMSIKIGRNQVNMKDFRKRQEATKRAIKMEIKTSFNIDMGKGNWSFPCCARTEGYVVREKSALKTFKNLDMFFDDTDEALSVSIELLSFQHILT